MSYRSHAAASKTCCSAVLPCPRKATSAIETLRRTFKLPPDPRAQYWASFATDIAKEVGIGSRMLALPQLGPAQDRPVDVGAQILTAHSAGRSPLNIGAAFGRNLTLSVGPLRYKDRRDADGNGKLCAFAALLVHEFEKFHAPILSESLNQYKHFAPSVVKRFAL